MWPSHLIILDESVGSRDNQVCDTNVVDWLQSNPGVSKKECSESYRHMCLVESGRIEGSSFSLHKSTLRCSLGDELSQKRVSNREFSAICPERAHSSYQGTL